MDVKSLNFSTAPVAGGELELSKIARRIVELRCAPAVSITVSRHRPDGWSRFSVAAGRVGTGQTTWETPFDLASVTKPLVAVAAAELARRSMLKLADPLAKWLPELQHMALGSASIESALAHRTGLQGHRILFGGMLTHLAVRRSRMLAKAAESVIPEYLGAPHRRVTYPTYSDLGYLIVGAILERAAGKDLDAVVAENVANPLGLNVSSSRQWQRKQSNFREIVAPTETISWRGGPLRGAVHDENAWAWAGYGASGHAGLFGTSSDVARFGEAMIDSLAGRVSSISRFAALVTTGLREDGTLRAGFDGISEGRSSAGGSISRVSFGHLGYTGTSLWCDPLNELVLVVLSNRVCPTRNNTRLPQARAEIHEQLFDWAMKKELSS